MTADGTKVPLGVAEGSTENAAVCTRLLADLAARGLDAEKGVLFVIDGDKAVANAIRDVSGDQAVSLAAEATRHATSVIAGPRPNDRCPSGGWARPSHPDPDAAHAELDALANKRPGAA